LSRKAEKKESTMGERVVISAYVHGVCVPNPGTGGWGAVYLLPDGQAKELSGAEAETTNNQMVLRAAVEVLRNLAEPVRVRLHSRSQYLCQGLPPLLSVPARVSYPSLTMSRVNEDLWVRLTAEAGRHQVECQWLGKSEGGRWQGRAEELARRCLPAPALPVAAEAIHLFVGACRPGGEEATWAVRLRFRQHIKELWGQEAGSPGPRLLVLAALRGLEAIKRTLPIHLYTTSDYVHAGFTRWLAGWQKRDWLTQEGEPIKHRDLWEPLADLLEGLSLRCHLLVNLESCEEMHRVYRLAQRAQAGAREALASEH
jgi:ribonuclease HI